MANDYRILDERDIKSFQAGNKLEVTEIGNKVTYEHIGEPPNTLPSKEKILEYGNSFNITVPSVYDSTGHVKSETKYSFIMPQETDTSNFLTTDNFSYESPIHIKKDGKNITYSHDEVSMTTIIPDSATQLTYGGTFEIPALSAADDYGHATEQKTYKFKMPTAVNVSGYITKDSFGSIDGNPVVKGENDKRQIAYSHKTLTPSPDNPATVDLEYGKEFKFTALSATDGYGHANKNTTYKFKMPTAVNVSGYITKDSFGYTEGNPVVKGENNDGKIIYYHTGSSPSTATEKEKDLTLGGFFNITVPSAYNSTGHVTTTQPYKFNMPPVPTIRECIGIGDTNSFYYYDSPEIGIKVTELSTTPDSDLTTIYFVTFYPGVGYSANFTENNTNYISSVVSPGPFTIPIATYQNLTEEVRYTFQALKFYSPLYNSKMVEKMDYNVNVKLETNADNRTAWFKFTFPMAMFSKITVMGF